MQKTKPVRRSRRREMPWPPTAQDLYERYAKHAASVRIRWPIVKEPWPPGQADLPYSDGVYMDSELHALLMKLLIETLQYYWFDRSTGFVAGDMAVFYERDDRGRKYRHIGPDVFVVRDGSKTLRNSWVTWEEGMGPDVVIELLSPSTARRDRTVKKDIYQDKLRVPEYFWYHPDRGEFAGFRLQDGLYRPIAPDANGRLFSEQIDLWLAPLPAFYLSRTATFLRWIAPDGVVLPTGGEMAQEARRLAGEAQQRAAEAQQRAAEAQQRAEAEAEAHRAAEQRISELEARLRERENGHAG